MKRQLFVLSAFLALAAVTNMAAQPGGMADPPPDNLKPDPRIAEFQNLSKGAKIYEGLFKLYQKDENLFAELQPQHLNKPYLLPIAVAKGSGIGGTTLNFDEQWVLMFKRVGEKVHLIRRNVRHTAKAGSPTAKAVDVTYSDSVLKSLRIVGINQTNMGIVINLNDIFMSDFAELGAGMFDPSRSVWNKVKAFPKNLELQVQATYTSFHGGSDAIIDERGKTVVIHYSIVELPDSGFQPRIADPRIGHFVTALKDYSSTSKDTTFVRYVNRWRLEPAEPIQPGRLSVPKRSIKFYIEKTVPHEYRAAVQDGILEWNKAFERIGFRNAIEVVQQRDDEDFDPEDMNYATFRWITTDSAFAVGPSRANPFTGELLDADILFDGDFIRFWKQERLILRNSGHEHATASPIEALNLGWGLNHPLLKRNTSGMGWNDRAQEPSNEDLRLRAIRAGVCQCGTHMKMELSMAAMALTMAEPAPQPKEAKEPKKDKEPKETDKLLDELLYQSIKHVVMHEVGHTLGLRHNFKASTMLKHEELHDTKITRERGVVASVMDYSPVNIAPKGTKQGDFYSVVLGPYDYWAIEYAYKPNATAEELQKIAARGPSTPGLDYGTDEDTFYTSDPTINRFDLGQDVMKFAQDRMTATDELLKTLVSRVVEDGESYQRVRVAFDMLLGQYGNGAYLVSRYVGGEFANRDHKADPKGRDPFVPVPAAKQREALKFLQERIFSDKSFQYPPELLRKLGVEQWWHWGSEPSRTDFPIFRRVLNIQLTAMNNLLSAGTLNRVQLNALKAEKDEKALTMSEVFRSVTDGVWGDLTTDGKKELALSTIQRNLQREHLKKLSSMVLGERGRGLFFILGGGGGGGGSLPPDAKSLARLHLKQLAKKIDAALMAKPAISDDLVRAHLEESLESINKVLSASMQVND